jgi:hypothetical protein
VERGPCTDEQRAKIADEAEELTENWDEADMKNALPPFVLQTDFQQALHKHHDLGLDIMNIRDTVIERLGLPGID